MAGLFNFGGMQGFDPSTASLGLMQIANSMNRRPRISTNPSEVTGPDDSMRETLGLMQYQQQAQRQKMLQEQHARQAKMDEFKIGQAQKEQADKDNFRAVVDGGDKEQINDAFRRYYPTQWWASQQKDDTLKSFDPTHDIYRGGSLVRPGTPKESAEPEYVKTMRALGIDPNSPEGQKMGREYLARKGQSPQVNIDMKQPTAEATEVGKFFGKTYSDIQSGAMAAPGTVAKLNRLEAALAKSPQGWGADTVQEVRRIGDAFGIKIGEGAGPGDVARSISNEMALQMRDPSGGAGMPGALSDADRKFLQMSTPGLAQTPEGNKMLIDYRRRLAKREQEIGKLAREYRQKKGTFDDGFLAELQSWSESNPLFTEDDHRKAQAASAAVSQAPQPGPSAAARVTSPADYERLPAGSIYVDPNGITRRKGGPASATVPIR